MARVLKIPDGPYAASNLNTVRDAVAQLRSDVFDLCGRDVPFGNVSITLEIRDGQITMVRPMIEQRIPAAKR